MCERERETEGERTRKKLTRERESETNRAREGGRAREETEGERGTQRERRRGRTMPFQSLRLTLRPQYYPGFGSPRAV